MAGSHMGMNNGSGDGSGYGSGYGYSDGSGYGSGAGDGYSNGSGDGYGYGSDAGFIYEVLATAPYLAWWYCSPDGVDHLGVRVVPEVGQVLTWDGRLELCRLGLHFSLTPAEAASYRQGWLCRVACSGKVILGHDKGVCTCREILAIYKNGHAPEGDKNESDL